MKTIDIRPSDRSNIIVGINALGSTTLETTEQRTDRAIKKFVESFNKIDNRLCALYDAIYIASYSDEAATLDVVAKIKKHDRTLT